MSDQKHLDQLASLLLSNILFFLHWKELQSTFYFHLCDNVRPNHSKFQIPVGSISAGQTLNLTFHLVYLWTWSRGAKVSSTSQLKSAQDKHPRYWDWRRLWLRCVAATGGQCNPGGGSNEAVDGKRLSVLASKDSVQSAVHAAGPRQFWWLRIHCPFPSKVRI